MVEPFPTQTIRAVFRALGALFLAFHPWSRAEVQQCGYARCQSVAPFSFYCPDHDMGLVARLQHWWGVYGW